uniref:Uncharacterized protein n=1 Tax=Sinocyclocheilus grahami TaxID=75366 RepID=A0A672MH84_SINGR
LTHPNAHTHISIYPEVVWINVEFVAVQLAELRVSAFDAIQHSFPMVSKGTEIPLSPGIYNQHPAIRINIIIFEHINQWQTAEKLRCGRLYTFNIELTKTTHLIPNLSFFLPI